MTNSFSRKKKNSSMKKEEMRNAENLLGGEIKGNFTELSSLQKNTIFA